MTIGKKIRVLIVDDSLLFREVLAKGITSDPQIEVVARAVDPFDARDKILAFNPDVMTCDVQMPKMDGIEFIRRLLPQYSLPVIVISSVSEAVLDALNAGAVDFVTKPDIRSPKDIESFLYELIAKIKVAAKAKVTHEPEKLISHKEVNRNLKVDYNKVIAIGASTGGTEALYNLLKNLPAAMPGILAVQHIPPVFSRMFAERLNVQTPFHVKEAENGDYLEPGKVFIAPGDSHMRIKKIGERYKIEIFQGNKVNGHCPSVDILFESVAKECGKNSIGIILTGMGYDGAKGLLQMRRKGARTIGQDERTSVVYGMPKIAWEIGAVEKQVSLESMPKTLLNALL
ncbi:chemotaxis response regulator protein-glutamate methylesterase [Desulfosporosinus sp. FKA]|uniref:protein-glutamate methylesterase/protein-glutamine glutaminase n=1 Tax=Desulfosporosinus sp. FKA TaxID=1969834 RepID=UPI000B49B1FA|nr:chemotaxis response regulator protein-glutamate methylesterase [Desulfosporosinus sp. FKA]